MPRKNSVPRGHTLIEVMVVVVLMAIIAAIEAGFIKEAVKTYEIEPDRKKAIVLALATANKGDIVIVAGKGHEDYQIFKDRTVHFSDAEVIGETLRAMEAV